MYGYIYKTTDLTNGLIYVGQKHSDHFIPEYPGSGSKIKQAIFLYKFRGVRQYVYIDKLDMLKHHTIHSFDPSMKHAKQIIEDTVLAKLNKAENDVKRYSKSLAKLKETQCL